MSDPLSTAQRLSSLSKRTVCAYDQAYSPLPTSPRASAWRSRAVAGSADVAAELPVVELPQCRDISRREPARRYGSDFVGGPQMLPEPTEVPLAIVGPAEAVHDVGELVGVRQAERMAELVQRRQVNNDARRQRLGRHVRGDGDLGPYDPPIRTVHVRRRFPLIRVAADEEHADRRIVWRRRASQREPTPSRGGPGTPHPVHRPRPGPPRP